MPVVKTEKGKNRRCCAVEVRNKRLVKKMEQAVHRSNKDGHFYHENKRHYRRHGPSRKSLTPVERKRLKNRKDPSSVKKRETEELTSRGANYERMQKNTYKNRLPKQKQGPLSPVPEESSSEDETDLDPNFSEIQPSYDSASVGQTVNPAGQVEDEDSSESSDGQEEHVKEQEESELESVKVELSQMSFEELQKLKEKLGTKVFNQVIHGNVTSSGEKRKEKTSFKRSNKKRPMEMSSKKKVSRFRNIIPVKKKVYRDPRFDENCGAFREDLFKKSYSFLDDIKSREKTKLQKQLKKSKDPEAKAKLKSLLSRVTQQQKASEEKEKKAQNKREWRKREQELVAQGKTPFYLKKSDQRTLELAEKYRELKKSGKLEKYLSKKRKKTAQKQRKKMMN